METTNLLLVSNALSTALLTKRYNYASRLTTGERASCPAKDALLGALAIIL
jgi:hypothetical protein